MPTAFRAYDNICFTSELTEAVNRHPRLAAVRKREVRDAKRRLRRWMRCRSLAVKHRIGNAETMGSSPIGSSSRSCVQPWLGVVPPSEPAR